MSVDNTRKWKLTNERLTDNFHLFEFIHWANQMINMSRSDKRLANELAKKHFTYNHYVQYKGMAHYLQGLRDRLNKDYNNRYSIIVTCGYRPFEWETYRGRIGSSQHTNCAVDIVVYDRILKKRDYKLTLQLYKELKEDFNGGLAVRYLDKKRKDDGALFLHIDFGPEARWTY